MNNVDEHPTQAERELVARLAALPRTLEPGRELWPAVQARIAPATDARAVAARGALARAAGFALAVLTALAAGTGIGYGYGKRVAERPPVNAVTPDLAHIELAFADAREGYLRQIALRGTALDEAERTALGTQLAVIDRAVHELRDAMAADPRNPVYIDTLLMTREREMELLADISGATLTRL